MGTKTQSVIPKMQKKKPDRQRLLDNIAKTGDGCWEWMGPLDRDGYGRHWRIGSRTDGSRAAIPPHRFAYMEFKGPIPKGLVIDHLCRNRRCVNPEHLEAVTSRENTQRGWRKNKTECKHGHPLSGDNLYIGNDGGRYCKTCRNRYAREHNRKTGGAAQKRYAATHREERRLATATRRANRTPEQIARDKERMKAYDAKRRGRLKSD